MIGNEGRADTPAVAPEGLVTDGADQEMRGLGLGFLGRSDRIEPGRQLSEQAEQLIRLQLGRIVQQKIDDLTPRQVGPPAVTFEELVKPVVADDSWHKLPSPAGRAG